MAKKYIRERIIEKQFGDMIQQISYSETEATNILEYVEADEKTEKKRSN